MKEIDWKRKDEEKRKVRREGNIENGIFGGILGERILKWKEDLKRERMFRGKGKDEDEEWERGIIGIGIGIDKILKRKEKEKMKEKRIKVEENGGILGGKDLM